VEAAHALAASPEASDRNGVEAVKLAERAVQGSGGRDPVYLDTLAAAYAEAERFPEAIAAARMALDRAAQQRRGQFIEALKPESSCMRRISLTGTRWRMLRSLVSRLVWTPAARDETADGGAKPGPGASTFPGLAW